MQVVKRIEPSPKDRHITILAGVLGGGGLIVILGCLIYLFLRRRRQRARTSQEATSEAGPVGDSSSAATKHELWRTFHISGPRFATNTFQDDSLSLPYASNLTVSEEPPLSEWAPPSLTNTQPPHSHPLLEQELPGQVLWNECPFGLDLVFGAERQIVIENPDINTSQPQIECSTEPNLQKSSNQDRGSPRSSGVPPSVSKGPISAEASSANPEQTGKISQSGIILNTPPPPPSILPKDPPPMVPTSFAPTQAPQQPTHLPLPPVINYPCPHCPRKFSSRARLE